MSAKESPSRSDSEVIRDLQIENDRLRSLLDEHVTPAEVERRLALMADEEPLGS